jgi:hypothetical protein
LAKKVKIINILKKVEISNKPEGVLKIEALRYLLKITYNLGTASIVAGSQMA